MQQNAFKELTQSLEKDTFCLFSNLQTENVLLSFKIIAKISKIKKYLAKELEKIYMKHCHNF